MSGIALLLALSAWYAPAADDGVPAFLGAYCTNCHGEKMQMAERRFDRVQLPANDVDTIILLQDIVDKMNLGAMPPQAAKQPSGTQRIAFIETLTRAIAEAHAKRNSTGGATVLRRLNRREYINTVGDLMAINMSMFDPTTRFPRDQMVGHMDNIGDALSTSGYLLEQFLDAADQVVEKAFRVRERAAVKTWTFHAPFRQQPELDPAHRSAHGMSYLSLYETSKTVRQEGSYGMLHEFAQGVPADGFYEIKVRAEAMNRRHPYEARIFNMDPDAPFRLGVVPGNARIGALHHSQPMEPQLGEVTLDDNGPESHTFRIWLDAGFMPRFTFPNGMIDGRRAFTQILNRYPQLLPPDQQDYPRGIFLARPHVLKYAKMPHIRITEVVIKGPYYDTWPLASHGVLSGGGAREVLTAFARRAYRRPATTAELVTLRALVTARRKVGRPPREALQDGLKAALCSPAFLYLSQANDGRYLDAHALASRLSYFLWSTMPDEELFSATSALAKPEALLAQTRRMLSHPKSQGFVEGFLDSWLNLRSLGDMPPDRDAFERYYAHDLQTAMRTETQMFARHLLDKNESILNFLDSDFTFVNKPLAKLYGMDAGMSSVDGHRFRQVKITNPIRGGLLGQGSVLTVSANGIETSPVTRGVWILENIFGTPPAPPPDNVPTIDPDVRGAKSMREILTKHRESPACMSCHVKIDPPGFALESFDPIGSWRDKYPNKVPIDPSGQLEDGKLFSGVAELKKLLLERKPQFARMLTERMLTYACGRRMEALDRPRVDRIVKELAARGYGFRDLVELVVLSEPFRSK
ncbi:MAG: DUF1592 domain-containing protein [Candidatus Solibacter usitatus]|nr:DUF1592 domain-containing protein [Candidatus Solibacter usitatus]